ncbi:MAG: ComF family protein [Candidatus Eremiobacterota bacterium]
MKSEGIINHPSPFTLHPSPFTTYMIFKDIIDGLIDLLYPPRCLLCKSGEKEWICERCIQNIDTSPLPFCYECMKEFFEVPDVCPECNSRKFACSLGFYEDLLKEAICRLKYEGKIVIGERLGTLMFQKFFNFFSPSWFDLILPVPLHKNRIASRGFNQAEILIRTLSYRMEFISSSDILYRKRDTKQQVTIPFDTREKNVKGAFGIRDHNSLKGKNILLVDDVFTTGATAKECSKTLLDSGANRVYLLVLAISTKKWKIF